MRFNKAVDVTGTPQLALAIGSATRQASYASGTGATELEFRYVVVQSDADADGLSIGANALTLQRRRRSTWRAARTPTRLLSLERTSAISNAAGFRVAGGTFTAPAVTLGGDHRAQGRRTGARTSWASRSA